MDLADHERAAGPPPPRPRPRTYAVTYVPPMPCGVATCFAALCDGLAEGGDDVVVVRVGDDGGGRAPRVVATLSDRCPTPAPRRWTRWRGPTSSSSGTSTGCTRAGTATPSSAS